MTQTLKASSDVIIRTNKWPEALKFYETVLGFPVVRRSETIVGFDTGSFCLYVEKGQEHGPVFDLLTSDVQAAKKRLAAADCVVLEENPSIPRCYLKDPFGFVFNLGED
jgi:catechol 2,3-dioxygenase-like lactoylglutathione lyase family enzyme